MSGTSRFFSSWTSLSSSRRSGASGEDGGEFGLDLPNSQCLHSYGGVPEIKPAACRAAKSSESQMAVKLRDVLLQIFVILAGSWILYAAAHRLYTATFGESPQAIVAAPSPAPSTAPRCPAYTYPQCEAAMRWYLSQNAKSRCEAFERVKAEGDFFKFPYSATQQDICSEAGCCGCSGQCSKCPPLLPECSSWRLDGTWKVAFNDGTEAKYTFDANGHCEAKLPTSALPVTWKAYDQTYLPQGSDDIAPQWMTSAAAKDLCESKSECIGITCDASKRSGENYLFYLKTSASIQPGPAGSPWKSAIKEQHSHLDGSLAVAGVLTQVASDEYVYGGTFRFDLHKASPLLFPMGSIEQLSVIGGELRVERRIVGKQMLGGTGVRSK